MLGGAPEREGIGARVRIDQLGSPGAEPGGLLEPAAVGHLPLPV